MVKIPSLRQARRTAPPAHLPLLCALLCASTVLLNAAARAEGDSDNNGNAPGKTVVAPSNNIAVCFDFATHDPLAGCGKGAPSVLQTVSFGSSSPSVTGSGSGAGAGKAVLEPLSFTKFEDGNTTELFTNALVGKSYSILSLAFYDTSGKVVRWFQFKPILVQSFAFADSVAPGGQAIESVALQYLALQTGQ